MNKHIKQLFAILASSTLVACSSTTKQSAISSSNDEDITIVGGYETATSPEITDEVQTICEKGLESMLGANYTPIALLATQVVSGTNYRVLLAVTPVVSDETEATETYSIATFYEDLDGNVEVTSIPESNIETYTSEESMGGWEKADSPIMTSEATNAFTSVNQDSSIHAIALLATQLVSGTNYRILCEEDGTYSIQTIYEDLKGNCELTTTETFPEVE